jgi:hypothetical protein
MDALLGGEDRRNIEVETADDRVVLGVLLWTFPHALVKGVRVSTYLFCEIRTSSKGAR